MMLNKYVKKSLLLAGDIILLYTSLFMALVLRYGGIPSKELWNTHNIPFAFITFFWIIAFYITDLYDIEKFISPSVMGKQVIKTVFIMGALSVLMFYSIPFFDISPKRVLLFYTVLSAFFIWLWRKLFFQKSITATKIKLFFIENESKEAKELIGLIDENPHFGYKIVNVFSDADIVVATQEIKKNPQSAQKLYKLVLSGQTVMSFDKLYESITGRIPVSLIDENWFLENLSELDKQTFEKIKRWLDIFLATIFSIPTIIIFPFVATAIKINSKGPVLIRQKRVGKNSEIFTLYKFRSMIALSPSGLAETNTKMGWQKPTGEDKRITFVGNIIRKTRIDELPQIWNVFLGDLSFVGPRPERPEFVEELEKEIPYYSMRHIIKPGLTGWAQINFSEASAKDAPIKLQYDLYYIKNRSVFFEIAILLRTAMVVLKRAGV